jgi:hypothetical protein
MRALPCVREAAAGVVATARPLALTHQLAARWWRPSEETTFETKGWCMATSLGESLAPVVGLMPYLPRQNTYTKRGTRLKMQLWGRRLGRLQHVPRTSRCVQQLTASERVSGRSWLLLGGVALGVEKRVLRAQRKHPKRPAATGGETHTRVHINERLERQRFGCGANYTDIAPLECEVEWRM